MNKVRAAAAIAVTALSVAGLSVAAAQPAMADSSWVCITNSPTPQYQGFVGYGGIGHELTHSEGRGFRVYYMVGGSGMADWAYGHGAQYPDNDGWVRADRLSC
jgi:hypothetical protein